MKRKYYILLAIVIVLVIARLTGDPTDNRRYDKTPEEFAAQEQAVWFSKSQLDTAKYYTEEKKKNETLDAVYQRLQDSQ